ncbi:hypothetical protein KAW65_00120 [candidate division WOR-3 bacterium]|nr:hypothetical protein [candidate division WOR-3 bacterium]
MFKDLIELVELPHKEGGPTHLLKIPVRLATGQGGTEDSESDEPKMTDAQRRFIFRLLGDKGIEGEQEVAEYLQENYEVLDLKKLGKRRASEIIEGLKEGG